jgi:hypothetical protein
MLLIFHYDKNDNESEEFTEQEIRLDLGFFPKPGSRLRLRMIGFNNNQRGGNIFIRFPDLKSRYLEEELIDFGSEVGQGVPGIMFSAQQGGFMNDAKDNDLEDGFGTYFSSSDNRILDLDLGDMDTQKDFFRMVVSGRRANNPSVGGTNNLNNFSATLEMVHQSAAT